MQKLVLTFLSIIFAFSSFGQNPTIIYDYHNNIFNENQELPSATPFLLKIQVPTDINLVEVKIYKNENSNNPIYSTEWKRPLGNENQTIYIPINQKLRGSQEYSFTFHFYNKMESNERINLAENLNQHLKTYINDIVQADSRKLTLNKNPKQILNEMNEVVDGALSFYRIITPGHFPGFSDMVLQKLEQIKGKKTKHAKYYVASNDNNEDYTYNLRNKEIEELLDLTWRELNAYMNGNIVVLSDFREIKRYPVERSSNYIALNVGYGGTYLSGDIDNLNIASSPYIGISFPLADDRYSSFWGNTSISLGVFIKDFKDKEDNKITGLIINKPFFAGVGYKFLHIFRAQAGAVFTSTEAFNGFQNIQMENFRVKPFIGLSAEINLWLGFDKNRK